VEVVLHAEGFDSELVDRKASAYVRNVREWLFDHGKGKGTRSGLPWAPVARWRPDFRPAEATRGHMDLQPEGLLNVRTGSA
jgi:hypothetical protein